LIMPPSAYDISYRKVKSYITVRPYYN